MTVGILTEKPSAMRAFSKALGGDTGTHNGESFALAHARGHLFELAAPEKQLRAASADEIDAMQKWALTNLPWDLDRFEWKQEPMKDVRPLLADIKKTFASCDEICIACDVDPSGEGGMIAANIINALGMAGKKISRMYFTDESAVSLQKAFTARKPVADLEKFDEYMKAKYRSAFDFGSIQFTRAATIASGQRAFVLPQGRLKSAMVKLVGDQLKAYNDYVKKPFFQNRFRDENNVSYVNPQEPTFDAKGDVPQTYHASGVVVDAKTDKATAPPRLLDLAGLSTVMAKSGLKPAQVLKIYQAGYDAQYFSYPRTDDKTITPEQFKDLSPLVDKIAAVVGVDTALLTHRQARATHVKPQGAHGANRPGLKVPASLSALDTELGKGAAAIYEVLAKNYLAMLAEDYKYEQQKGHVKDFPDFKGIANVPLSPGWKAVFDADAGDADSADENESSKGLGSKAEPIIFEGANKRPEHPSMKWLLKQLEKRDVGTGATRTSTYADVTNEKAKNPLLVDKRSKLTLGAAGEISWLMLPGTHIGDLSLTEKVYANMREVAAGKADPDELLGEIAGWVKDDIITMQNNSVAMRATLGLTESAVEQKEKVSGVWSVTGSEVSFSREWGGHRFTDDEVSELLAGRTIDFSATSSAGKAYDVFGELAKGTFKGRAFIGFNKLGFGKRNANGEALPPSVWCGHKFTDAELAELMAGKSIEATDFTSKAGKKFGCKISFKEEKPGEGKKLVPDFGTGTEPPLSWCGVTFTATQRKSLATGKPIEVKGALSAKSGKKFDCKLVWKAEGSSKKLVPSFGK